MTDHYAAVEDATIKLVQDHLENHATFFPKPEKQVAKSNDDVLSEGFDYFFITYPASFPLIGAGTGVVEVTWHIKVEIFVRVTTHPQTWANFKAFRSAVFNLFNISTIGRTLNRTPGVGVGLSLESNSDPIFYGEENTPNDPIFYSQVMQLSVPYKINR